MRWIRAGFQFLMGIVMLIVLLIMVVFLWLIEEPKKEPLRR